ncbi:MAG: phosphodiester glycosidase family protein [Clostridia bacterium]|nr:phosphodiester glycosidase family protein [Clostridia bacterium]
MKRIVLITTAIVLLISFAAASFAFESIPKLSGEQNRKEKEIYPGVVYTSLTTPAGSAYGNQGFNIVRFDLKQRDLYLETFYYNNDARRLATVSNDVTQYNQKHPDKTVIAAVNGDMWMVSYAHARIQGSGTSYGGYSDAVVKKELTVSRSYNVVDGEIFTSGTIEQETPYAGPAWAFGITDDFVPLLGQPVVDIKAFKTGGSNVKIDGINRLPANNAIVMYTDRVMSTYKGFALDDAYEILVEFDSDYKPAHGMDVTGKVKAIYGPDSASNPDFINEKQMVLTARGNKISLLKQFAVGDSIRITLSVSDIQGNTEEWQRVQHSIGGNIVYVQNGVLTGNGLESGYPTTLLGYDNSGCVVMLTMNGRGYGGAGANGDRLARLCKELNLYNAFILDGGGSMTMVVNDGTGYKPVSHAVDSSGTAYRSVNNALILSHGPERAAQGDFEIELPLTFTDPYNISFPTPKHVNSLISSPNQATFSWEDDALKLTVSNMNTQPGMADPYVSLSYSGFETKANANQYKFITLVYKVPASASAAQYSSELFCQCEGRGAEAGQSVLRTVKRTGKYEYVTFDASGLSKWKNSITGFRIDFFAGSMKNGDTMYIHNIILNKTAAEASSAASAIVNELNGTEPDPTQTPTPKPTATPTPKPTATPTPKPTATPTPKPTATPTPDPTATPTPKPTATPTPDPTATPSPEPTQEPTPEPTDEPTLEPTEEPTELSTDEPTELPTEEPTVEPTEEPASPSAEGPETASVPEPTATVTTPSEISKDSGKIGAGTVIAIAAGVAVLTAAVIIVVIARKKKK